MKYLFYNCQLLLLCCACCKFAIQAFVHEDRHAIQPTLAKNCQFYRQVYRRTYTRQYFTESCKQNYGLLPQLPMGIPTAVYPSVFNKELQTKLRPFSTITDGYTDGGIPVGISQRVANKAAFFHNYRRVYRRTYTRQYFTENCKTITAFCHNYRLVYRRTCHNYRYIPTLSPTDGAQSEVYACQNLPTVLPTNAEKTMRACSGAQFPIDFPTDFEKYGGIFEIFAQESIKYRRKLPTEFNATAQKIIIICSVGNSVGNIVL